MRQRAVIDTNVLVSGLLRSGGPPAMILDSIVEGRLEPVLCRQTVAEYARVLRRPGFGFESGKFDELVTLIGQQGIWVDVPDYPQALDLPDPSDWPFAAMALALRCPLISGNARHFPDRLGLTLYSPRAWLEARPGIAQGPSSSAP
jgi:predicted nucleic acid-binding protein